MPLDPSQLDPNQQDPNALPAPPQNRPTPGAMPTRPALPGRMPPMRPGMQRPGIRPPGAPGGPGAGGGGPAVGAQPQGLPPGANLPAGQPRPEDQSPMSQFRKGGKVKAKDRKSTRLNSSHSQQSRMPSSA
mgnify:CR=1 FL=1